MKISMEKYMRKRAVGGLKAFLKEMRSAYGEEIADKEIRKVLEDEGFLSDVCTVPKSLAEKIKKPDQKEEVED